MGKGIIIIMMMILGMAIEMRAQQECWERILACAEGADTRAEYQQECCDSFVQEITNERECFCTIKSTIAGNATLVTGLNSILSLCDVSQSFHTLCPGPPSSLAESPAPSPAAGSTVDLGGLSYVLN